MNAYHERITELFDEYYTAPKDDKPTPTDRIKAADKIIETYIGKHGERPPKSILSRLATYILLDTLTDSHPDKMSREEYPIMSYGQTGRYFARNGTIAPDPYTQESVMGRKTSAKEWGNDNSDALLFADDPMLMGVIESVDLYALLDNANLTDRQRQAIDLVYFDDLTQEQAAKVMGIGQDVVSRNISVSIDKIRKFCEQYHIFGV